MVISLTLHYWSDLYIGELYLSINLINKLVLLLYTQQIKMKLSVYQKIKNKILFMQMSPSLNEQGCDSISGSGRSTTTVEHK